MSRITINSNPASLQAQRYLAQSTKDLRANLERLSSGLRVSRAADDAAGLSVAEDHKVNALVFAQGVRNINDGVSLLNVAEGAAHELAAILTRTRELSTQAANGTLSYSQRRALDAEADALADEFNRIVASTDFNGMRLIERSLDLRVQAGYGEDAAIVFQLGQGVARTAGDGTFENPVNFSTPLGETHGVELGDFNADGNLDLAACAWSAGGGVHVLIGRGDGTFEPTVLNAGPNATRYVRAGDLNNDGALDLVTTQWNAAGSLGVYLGNGDGTFQSRVAYGSFNTPEQPTLADMNADGALDAVFAVSGENKISVLFNQGDGTFGPQTDLAASAQRVDAAVSDFNNDGILDIAAGGSGNAVDIFLGAGQGAFGSRSTFAAGSGNVSDDLTAGDFNGDGAVDLAVSDRNSNGFVLLLGGGTGAFGAPTLVSEGANLYDIAAVDLNEDGALDVIGLNGVGGQQLSVFINNGDGSFAAAQRFATAASTRDLAYGDVNGDGALDIAVSNAGSQTVGINQAHTTEISFLNKLDLRWRESALASMAEIDEALAGVSEELAAIGAVQSRLATATENLRAAQQNYLTAASQIMDADVAEETARLVKNRMLQEAGAAILGQANQLPQLAVLLLNG